MRDGRRAGSLHVSEKAQARSDPTRNSTLHGLVRKLRGDNNLLLVERGGEGRKRAGGGEGGREGGGRKRRREEGQDEREREQNRKNTPRSRRTDIL